MGATRNLKAQRRRIGADIEELHWRHEWRFEDEHEWLRRLWHSILDLCGVEISDAVPPYEWVGYQVDATDPSTTSRHEWVSERVSEWSNWAAWSKEVTRSALVPLHNNQPLINSPYSTLHKSKQGQRKVMADHAETAWHPIQHRMLVSQVARGLHTCQWWVRWGLWGQTRVEEQPSCTGPWSDNWNYM